MTTPTSNLKSKQLTIIVSLGLPLLPEITIEKEADSPTSYDSSAIIIKLRSKAKHIFQKYVQFASFNIQSLIHSSLKKQILATDCLVDI